jgi:hypothetical protein
LEFTAGTGPAPDRVTIAVFGDSRHRHMTPAYAATSGAVPLADFHRRAMSIPELFVRPFDAAPT